MTPLSTGIPFKNTPVVFLTQHFFDRPQLCEIAKTPQNLALPALIIY